MVGDRTLHNGIDSGETRLGMGNASEQTGTEQEQGDAETTAVHWAFSGIPIS
jgi:hypothetical protein